ncbi:translation initiation factor IF-5A [Candidatus Woesearchaeota archaeon]|nr:translation initiation factor IF-5A [Candidatus Woesearchaeota archaeon]
MGETKPVAIGTLKKGNYIVIDGFACKVVDIQVSRPGKHGHAKIRMTGVGITDGKKRVIVAPGHDNVDTPIVEKKTAQVLSVSGNKANVMDNESYETFDLEIPDELKGQVNEGGQVLYWVVLDDKVMKQVQG